MSNNEHILFSLDKVFDDLNEAISSFGGMYYNSDGDLVDWGTDLFENYNGVFSPIAGVRQDLGDIKVGYWW